MLFKLTSSLLAFFGVSTPEAFAASFETFLKDSKEKLGAIAGLTDADKTHAQAIEKLATDLKASNDKVSSLEQKLNGLSTLTEAQVRQIATEAAATKGSQAAVEAVAGIGAGSPVAPAPAQPAAVDAVKNLEAQGKYAEAYLASASIRAEFPNAECYAAYMKNQHRARIK